MNPQKHTRGPWEVRRFKKDDLQRVIVGNIVEDGDGHTMTTVAVVSGNATSQQVTEANANLLAASTELLEACEEWVEYFDQLNRDSDPSDKLTQARNQWHRSRIETTRAAIAKAKGAL